MEQLPLGNVGIDSASITLGWTWEQGWTAKVSTRLSGQDYWYSARYQPGDEAALHAVLSDHLADILGLI